MVNQAFRIKIAYRSKKKKEKKEKKIPGIGRYPVGPTKSRVFQEGSLSWSCVNKAFKHLCGFVEFGEWRQQTGSIPDVPP